MKGTVKWFNMAKGFGFITGEDGKDYFIHHSGITKGRTIKSLDPEDEVEFDPGQSEKGAQAENVTLIKEAGTN